MSGKSGEVACSDCSKLGRKRGGVDAEDWFVEDVFVGEEGADEGFAGLASCALVHCWRGRHDRLDATGCGRRALRNGEGRRVGDGEGACGRRRELGKFWRSGKAGEPAQERLEAVDFALQLARREVVQVLAVDGCVRDRPQVREKCVTHIQMSAWKEQDSASPFVSEQDEVSERSSS